MLLIPRLGCRSNCALRNWQQRYVESHLHSSAPREDMSALTYVHRRSHSYEHHVDTELRDTVQRASTSDA